MCFKIKSYRRTLSKFRCASHILGIKKGRQNKIDYNDRFCKYCKRNRKDKVQDEYSGFVLSMEYLEKYEIQLSVFKVMNSIKFRVAVLKSMDFGEFFFRAVLNFCMPVYF